jgi:hypothetical protein
VSGGPDGFLCLALPTAWAVCIIWMRCPPNLPRLMTYHLPDRRPSPCPRCGATRANPPACKPHATKWQLTVNITCFALLMEMIVRQRKALVKMDGVGKALIDMHDVLIDSQVCMRVCGGGVCRGGGGGGGVNTASSCAAGSPMILPRYLARNLMGSALGSIIPG